MLGTLGHQHRIALKNCITWINNIIHPRAASNLVTKVCQNVKYTTEYIEGTVKTRMRKIADILLSKST